MSGTPEKPLQAAPTDRPTEYSANVKSQMSAFTPPTEEEVSKALRSLHTGQYWWNKVNSFILEQVFMQGYHDRQSELRLRLTERFNFVSPIDRLPILTDPIFTDLKQVQFSAEDRRRMLDLELRKRVRNYAFQVKRGDLDAYKQIPTVIVPLLLAETSQSTQTGQDGLQTSLTNLLTII